MATDIKFKRGAAATIPALQTGEPAFTTDTKRLYVGSSTGNVCINPQDLATTDGPTFDHIHVTDYIAGGPYVQPEQYGAVGDGTTDDTTAIQAAITAGIAAKLPVILSSTYMFTSTLSLGAYTTIIGVNTAGNATAGYGAVLKFMPSSAIPALDVAFVASYIQSVQLENFQIDGSSATTYPTIAINYEGVLGGCIRGVGIVGPFSTAGIVVDGPLDCQIEKVNIGNANTTQAMAAGILFKGTPWIGTTTRVKDIYIHGVLGATGGITDGIVCEGDAILGLVLDKPIVESLARYGFNFHKGNYVDIYSPYVENVPNIDAATPIFRIAKDTLTASYINKLNIHGGLIGGPNSGYSSVYAFDIGSVVAIINILGVSFERLPTFMNSTNSTTAFINIDGCICQNSTAFGTISNPNTLYFQQNNRFQTNPTTHRLSGLYTSVPPYYKQTGQYYFSTDKLSAGSPLWWNGTNWVDAFSDVDGDVQETYQYWRGDKSWQTLNQSAVEQNLVTNGDFTSDTSDWTASGGYSTLASVTGGQSGNCLEMTRVSSTAQYAHQNVTTVVGKTYKLTAYAKSGTSGNETAIIGVGALNFNSILSYTYGTSSGSWVQYSLTWTADRTNPCVFVEKGSATAGTMLFDTVWFGEVANTIDQDLSTTSGPTFDHLHITHDVAAESFTIGANSLTTSEVAYLDGQNQAVKTTDGPTFDHVHLTDSQNITGLDTTDGPTFDHVHVADASTYIDNRNGDLHVVTAANRTLVLDQPVYDDLMVSVLSAKPGTANPPGFSVFRQDTGAASTGVFLYWFDKDSEEDLFFAVQLPHSWKEGTAIHPHVHWTPKSTADGNPANQKVIWALEYTWVNIGGTFGVTQTVTGSTHFPADANVVANKHYLTELTDITPDSTQGAVSSMLVCRLYRDADAVADNYEADAGLLQFDFHYQIDTLGSRTELSKGQSAVGAVAGASGAVGAGTVT